MKGTMLCPALTTGDGRMPNWTTLCQMVAQLTGRPSLDADDEVEKAGYEAWLATLPAEQRPLE